MTSAPSGTDVLFFERISAAAPTPFVEAVRVAARQRGGTVSDYVRAALSERLARDGVAHQRPPSLQRLTYLHRAG